VSKVIERLVLARIKSLLFTSDNFSRFQSAYRQGHSTETALPCTLESVYAAINNKKLAVLVGLDISAAFDTVNHAILLERLHSVFGVTGTALNWLSSYLFDRQQFVQLGSHQSSTIPCFSGVPQGSVLGALLFIAYVSQVGDVITRYVLNYQQYANDTHLILAVSAATIHSDLSAVEICSSAVKLWFAQNHLLLNADKSELMFIGTSAQLSAVAIESIKVAGAKLPVSTKIKSFGVIIDSRLSFYSQVNTIARACNYHIWALRHIRRPVTVDVAKMLACSIIGARLDYCNSLLNGTSNKSIAILQRLQNSLARVVLQMPRCAHTTPLLQSLH
jgi:Reverse transcriptase (RNA-dependent DNA polymerase)